MADLFWLRDEQWAVIGRFMPTNRPGAWRVDDRRVISWHHPRAQERRTSATVS